MRKFVPLPIVKYIFMKLSFSMVCDSLFILHYFAPFHLKIALGQLVPNAWRTIISCMSIWVFVHKGDMIKLNEFMHLYHLKPSTHHGYYEL